MKQFMQEKTESRPVGGVLWEPTAERAASSQMAQFRAAMAAQHGIEFDSPAALHAWSIADREAFWRGVISDSGLLVDGAGEDATALENGDAMPGARWFPDARLNFAENLLHAGAPRDDDAPAIVFMGEQGGRQQYTHRELREDVAKLASALAADGVGVGTRVAAFIPNIPQATIAMLAVTSLGGVWSSCSPDFGVEGVSDRFGQIEPEVLFTANGYHYAGKTHASMPTICALAERLPSVRRIVAIDHVASDLPPVDPAIMDRLSSWQQYLDDAPARPLTFERLPFDHPLYILYSSGTTGKPKCIVHGAGGTLLQHVKEHRLHADVRPGDRVFFFTTCGWMMWNWLVSGLASGATLMLFDGSPFHPDGNVLWRYAESEKFTQFGTSAKYIDACNKAGMAPGRDHDLDSLRLVMSTGSTLSPESFDYVYESIKSDVCLSSMSGGTDIVSCFVLGHPELPVRRGELQAYGLGLDIAAFDADGRALPAGSTGELVCQQAFPCMPSGFFGDDDGSRYKAAYFERFDNVWCHGDWVTPTETGGLVIHGRSDATLNPGGVRIGTAEIYRQVESLSEIAEAIVIGQRWDSDTRVVLFVRLSPGASLDEALEKTIRTRIRKGASPRHVPAVILAVDDIPRTRSGKIVELAVAKVVNGDAVDNVGALANAEALELFRDREELSAS